jgi:protein SCO1/2
VTEPARSRRTPALLALALAALLALTLLLVWGVPTRWAGPLAARWFGAPRATPFHARDVTDEGLGGTVVGLADTSGRPRQLAEFRGQVVVLTFGYTNCPDFCPTTLAKLAEARRLMGADGARLQVLFVTVDPARDSAKLLGNYVPAFDPSFIGLRGTEDQVDELTRAFHASYQVVQYQGQTIVEHTASSYVIDPQGRTRLISPYDQTARSLADDLLALLRGQ